MSETQEQIIARRDAEEMRQLRAEFEKLWLDKLKPILIGAYPKPVEVEVMRAAHLCWLAFKEGKSCPVAWSPALDEG